MKIDINKKIKICISVICFSIFFVLIYGILKWLLVDDVRSYTRLMMHELYTQEENIDILFVGSSHCYRSFDTRVTDEIFGCNTFNAGTSSQGLDGSLQLIKEASKENEIKQVYLELYYGIATQPEYKERTQMTSTYIISDYLKPSLERVQYILQASSKEYYFNSFLLPRRNWEKLLDLTYMYSLVQKKVTDEYKNFEYTYVTGETEAYIGKGYVENYTIIPGDIITASFRFGELNCNDLSQDWQNSLMDIIEYCQNENIELVLVSAPMPDIRLAGMGNYDDYVCYVNELIKETDVKYYDFNLCNTKYFSYSNELFYDTDHLNSNGAEAFSTIFSEFFSGSISEEELFYHTYREKIESMDDAIFGAVVINDIKQKCVIIELIGNIDFEAVSYEVIKKEKGEEELSFIKTDKGITIPYDEGETGSLEINLEINGEETSIITEYGVQEDS